MLILSGYELAVYSLSYYLITCYIYYRIAQKFDNNISYYIMLIPCWNFYLILKLALDKRFAVYYFWGYIFINFIFNSIEKYYSYNKTIMISTEFIANLILAIPIAFIAKKLGKNFWIYLIAFQIPFLINTWIGVLSALILVSIMAFDKSNPTTPPIEEITNK